MLEFLAGVAVGLVVGFLFYRNNKIKSEALVAEVKAQYDELKAKVQ